MMKLKDVGVITGYSNSRLLVALITFLVLLPRVPFNVQYVLYVAIIAVIAYVLTLITLIPIGGQVAYIFGMKYVLSVLGLTMSTSVLFIESVLVPLFMIAGGIITWCWEHIIG